MAVGALYAHVPFCARKCAYCDFASWETGRADPLMGRYVEALCAQVGELVSCGVLTTCATGYVGGGTPSLLGPDLLSGLLAALPVADELTFEANPDSLTEEVLTAARSAGATRVSVGVQSLVDAELEALGRLHDGRGARQALERAVASGLVVSCDLMCATPRQTDESWRESLAGVIATGVDHVSVYPLMIEEGTPLAARYEDADTSFNDEDVEATRMEAAARALTEAGYARYEVASYARAGRTCRHNVCYWTGVPYLGLGTAASSMLGRDDYEALRTCCPQLGALPEDIRRVRLRCVSDRHEIAADARLASLHFELELLDGRQAWAEDLMLGMRMTDGVARSLLSGAERTLDRLLARGLVACQGERVVPTHAGWLLGNELYGELWDLAGSPVREVSC